MTQSPLRAALHLAVDLLADAVEGRAADNQNDNATAPAPITPKASKAKQLVANNDLKTEEARQFCLKNGWPLPPNSRRTA